MPPSNDPKAEEQREEGHCDEEIHDLGGEVVDSSTENETDDSPRDCPIHPLLAIALLALSVLREIFQGNAIDDRGDRRADGGVKVADQEEVEDTLEWRVGELAEAVQEKEESGDDG